MVFGGNDGDGLSLPTFAKMITDKMITTCLKIAKKYTIDGTIIPVKAVTDKNNRNYYLSTGK